MFKSDRLVFIGLASAALLLSFAFLLVRNNSQLTVAENCSIAIAGSVEGSDITNICGIPTELLAEIVAALNASKEDIEDLAEDRRKQIELLEQALDLTQGQILAALQILGETDVTREALAPTLIRVALQFQELRHLSELRPGDTDDIVKLKQEALEEVEAGNLDTADHLLTRVEALQERLGAEMSLRRAETRADRARLELIRQDFSSAAELFHSAAEIVPVGEEFNGYRNSYLAMEAQIRFDFGGGG